MKGTVPQAVTVILCEWDLVRSVFPAGSDRRETKTYLHRSPRTGSYSIIRMVDGKFAGHMILTDTEIRALGDIAA